MRKAIDLAIKKDREAISKDVDEILDHWYFLGYEIVNGKDTKRKINRCSPNDFSELKRGIKQLLQGENNEPTKSV